MMFVIAIIFAVLTATGEAKSTNNDDILREKLVELQRRHVDWLLDHPDVTAVDVNHKTVGGERTDQLSLVLWVREKLPEHEIPHERRLPREIEGFHTDVIEGEMAQSLEGFQTGVIEGEIAESTSIKVKKHVYLLLFICSLLFVDASLRCSACMQYHFQHHSSHQDTV